MEKTSFVKWSLSDDNSILIATWNDGEVYNIVPEKEFAGYEKLENEQMVSCFVYGLKQKLSDGFSGAKTLDGKKKVVLANIERMKLGTLFIRPKKDKDDMLSKKAILAEIEKLTGKEKEAAIKYAKMLKLI